jgi:hypothetical protein
MAIRVVKQGGAEKVEGGEKLRSKAVHDLQVLPLARLWPFSDEATGE